MVLGILGCATFLLLGYFPIDLGMDTSDIFKYILLPELFLAFVIGIAALVIILKKSKAKGLEFAVIGLACSGGLLLLYVFIYLVFMFEG